MLKMSKSSPRSKDLAFSIYIFHNSVMKLTGLQTLRGIAANLKVEKEYYSGYEAFKVFKSEIQFYSCFLDLESFILESDSGFDGFHLNQEGHLKLAKELVKLLR